MRKVYVKVNADFDSAGNIIPRVITWEDGRRYSVDRVTECRPAASLKVGGRGLRYRCRIGRMESYLFYEEGKWFVEAKQ